MWEFDLSTKSWHEIHPASGMRPGARSGAYLTVLDESRQIVLFGCDTDTGPISDVWLYDMDSEIVTFIQWQGERLLLELTTELFVALFMKENSI